MGIKNKQVCLLYRKSGRFFSIERIFHGLLPLLQAHLKAVEWEVPYAQFRPRELIRNIIAARKCKADLYHITGDIHYLAAGLPRARTLLTIHDCVFLYNSSGLKRRLLKWLLLEMPVRRSRLVTTISEATKRDIIEHTGCAAEKIVVIPNPADRGTHYTAAPFREEEPVILFIGSTPNKNLESAVKALAGIPCLLDIVGSLSQSATELLADNSIRYRQQSGLNDEEMAKKYSNADIILFPSTFEGFGLPVIEGQQAGRPVVTSNISPLKEVAGDAACLVDPHNISSIRQGILRVIEDASYREGLVSAGFRNIQNYAPEYIAGQYIACYEKLLKE